MRDAADGVRGGGRRGAQDGGRASECGAGALPSGGGHALRDGVPHGPQPARGPAPPAVHRHGPRLGAGAGDPRPPQGPGAADGGVGHVPRREDARRPRTAHPLEELRRRRRQVHRQEPERRPRVPRQVAERARAGWDVVRAAHEHDDQLHQGDHPWARRGRVRPRVALASRRALSQAARMAGWPTLPCVTVRITTYYTMSVTVRIIPRSLLYFPSALQGRCSRGRAASGG
eukprot:3839807-Pyramimonas_sp.AAC.1